MLTGIDSTVTSCDTGASVAPNSALIVGAHKSHGRLALDALLLELSELISHPSILVVDRLEQSAAKQIHQRRWSVLLVAGSRSWVEEGEEGQESVVILAKVGCHGRDVVLVGAIRLDYGHLVVGLRLLLIWLLLLRRLVQLLVGLIGRLSFRLSAQFFLARDQE